MRVKLYQDRTALEKVLLEAERTLKGRALSVPLMEDAVRLHEALDRFGYVAQMRLSQSDERHLQERFNRAQGACRQAILDGVPRLGAEIRYAHPTLQKQVQQVYESFGGSAAPAVSPRTIQQMAVYRQELQNIFTGEHIVSDGSLQKQCMQLNEIIIDLRRYSKANSAASVIASELISYAKREGTQLKLRLTEHLGRALVEYPDKLRAAGKSRLETGELMHLYASDCSTVEHLLERIIRQAEVPADSALANTKQLIVGAMNLAACDTLEKQLRGYGPIERFSYIPYFALFTDERQAMELLKRPKKLFSDGTAIYEARPYRVNPRSAPFHSTIWNIDMVEAPKAWEYTRGDGAAVAIIDTGVDYEHSDLEACFGSVKGVDLVNGTDPSDDNGHGTHVAGTVAGLKTGVAPQATLYAVKVLDSEGSGSEVAVLRGIEWAIEHNVHVINMSLGSSYPSRPEAQLIGVAAEKGICVACAAGNDGDSSYNYPASHPGAISVAAVDRYKDRASFSNYNDEVDLCAPGLEVYSTWPGGGYRVLAGTSMASPHVAGACALLASVGVTSIEDALKRDAEKLGRKDYFGSGLIKIAEAINGSR